jgi:hypothetical protein
MTGVKPSRLAVHHPRVRFDEGIGIAVNGLAVEGDGGECYHRREFQLEQLAPGSRQSLDGGPLSEDAIAEPGHGIAATLDDIAEQRIVRAVGDAEDSLKVRQSDELGGARRDGNSDCHAANVCFT